MGGNRPPVDQCRARLLLSPAVSDRCFIGIRIDADGQFQMSLHLVSPPLQVRAGGVTEGTVCVSQLTNSDKNNYKT